MEFSPKKNMVDKKTFRMILVNCINFRKIHPPKYLQVIIHPGLSKAFRPGLSISTGDGDSFKHSIHIVLATSGWVFSREAAKTPEDSVVI